METVVCKIVPFFSAAFKGDIKIVFVIEAGDLSRLLPDNRIKCVEPLLEKILFLSIRRNFSTGRFDIILPHPLVVPGKRSGDFSVKSAAIKELPDRCVGEYRDPVHFVEISAIVGN